MALLLPMSRTGKPLHLGGKPRAGTAGASCCCNDVGTCGELASYLNSVTAVLSLAVATPSGCVPSGTPVSCGGLAGPWAMTATGTFCPPTGGPIWVRRNAFSLYGGCGGGGLFANYTGVVVLCNCVGTDASFQFIVRNQGFCVLSGSYTLTFPFVPPTSLVIPGSVGTSADCLITSGTLTLTP